MIRPILTYVKTKFNIGAIGALPFCPMNIFNVLLLRRVMDGILKVTLLWVLVPKNIEDTRKLTDWPAMLCFSQFHGGCSPRPAGNCEENRLILLNSC